jgi:hypothetical protein
LLLPGGGSVRAAAQKKEEAPSSMLSLSSLTTTHKTEERGDNSIQTFRGVCKAEKSFFILVPVFFFFGLCRKLVPKLKRTRLAFPPSECWSAVKQTLTHTQKKKKANSISTESHDCSSTQKRVTQTSSGHHSRVLSAL